MTFDLPAGLSHASPYLALRVDDPDGHGWKLEIMRLPGADVLMSIPLLSEANYPASMSPADLSPDLVSGILDDYALSWSPDGRYLAFVAAIDGPSTDLYVYDTTNNGYSRLSTGSLQVATPFWTLDSSRIIYQVVETFGSGAGWISKSVYSINVDGTHETLIARLPDMVGPLHFLGITKSGLLLADMFSQLEIPKLQLIDTKNGGMKAIGEGDIRSADIDPISGAYAYIDVNGKLYYTGSPSKAAKLIDAEPWNLVSWSPIAAEFFVIGDERVDLLFAIESDYMLSPSFATGCNLTRSPDGNILCLAGQTLHCESIQWKKDIGDYPNAVVLWNSTSTGFFFESQGDLYYVPVSDLQPRLIDFELMPVHFIEKTLTPYYIGWVGK